MICKIYRVFISDYCTHLSFFFFSDYFYQKRTFSAEKISLKREMFLYSSDMKINNEITVILDKSDEI